MSHLTSVLMIQIEARLDVVCVSHSTADVLSEETILKWFKDAHAAKGKSVFLEQMKKFVEWLHNAEEGEDVYWIKIFSAKQNVNLKHILS